MTSYAQVWPVETEAATERLSQKRFSWYRDTTARSAGQEWDNEGEGAIVDSGCWTEGSSRGGCPHRRCPLHWVW
jgi:hypothetical protein